MLEEGVAKLRFHLLGQRDLCNTFFFSYYPPPINTIIVYRNSNNMLFLDMGKVDNFVSYRFEVRVKNLIEQNIIIKLIID